MTQETSLCFPCTLAEGFLSLIAADNPFCTVSTTGLQSTKNSDPGSARKAAWNRAQASVPGISTIQSGGIPQAMAMTWSSLSTTTNTQLLRANKAVGPSSREPSE